VTDDCGRTSATSRPSTKPSPPSTPPSDARGRRSSAFVREDSTSVSALRLFERLPRHPVVTIASAMKLLDTSKPTANPRDRSLGILVDTRCLDLILPEVFEPVRRQGRVADRGHDRSVAKTIASDSILNAQAADHRLLTRTPDFWLRNLLTPTGNMFFGLERKQTHSPRGEADVCPNSCGNR
jgi:hypothetical protein